MKYLGSKARFAKEILPIMLRQRKVGQFYVEPFAGGMNCICNVQGPAIANDVNPFLVAMWRALQAGWVPPIVDRETYNKIRDNKSAFPAELVGWVGFNCSYSGKFFGGFAGKVDTREGVRDYQEEARRNTLAQSAKLARCLFFCSDYQSLVIPQKSIVYCDPPYKGTTGYLNDIDHWSFWEWVRKLDKEGHVVFVSEYEAPHDFVCVWEKKATSSLSANGKCGANKMSVERLYTMPMNDPFFN